MYILEGNFHFNIFPASVGDEFSMHFFCNIPMISFNFLFQKLFSVEIYLKKRSFFKNIKIHIKWINWVPVFKELSVEWSLS